MVIGVGQRKGRASTAIANFNFLAYIGGFRQIRENELTDSHPPSVYKQDDRSPSSARGNFKSTMQDILSSQW
jgi:hypothetical protein